jgi:hypothetical protein
LPANHLTNRKPGSDADVVLRRTRGALRKAGVVIYICAMSDWWNRIRHGLAKQSQREKVKRNMTMAWTTPTLVEICIGLEIIGYLPAEI